MGDERELEGPGSYERYNKISLICQQRYFIIFYVQILSLVFIAALSSLVPTAYQNNPILLIELILIIIVFLSMIFQNRENYTKGWQKARFLAESILSNAWLFAWKFSPYDVDDTSDRNFLDMVEILEKEVDLRQFHCLDSHQRPEISDWMKNFRNENLDVKKQKYIEYRLEDQIGWYSKKAKLNQDRSTQSFWAGLGLMGVGAILTLLILIDFLPNLSFLGFFTTAAAGVFSFSQAKRHDELKETYGVSAMELNRFKARIESIPDDELIELVVNTEKAISREHKLWFAGLKL
jgi:hypothetical protein